MIIRTVCIFISVFFDKPKTRDKFPFWFSHPSCSDCVQHDKQGRLLRCLWRAFLLTLTNSWSIVFDRVVEMHVRVVLRFGLFFLPCVCHRLDFPYWHGISDRSCRVSLVFASMYYSFWNHPIGVHLPLKSTLIRRVHL